jgi:S-adenosylmethionine uptake transporter
MILYRLSVTKETNTVQLFTTNLVLFVICGGGLVFSWQSLSGMQWSLMLLIGAIGTLAQFLLLVGMRQVPASVAAPLEFSALIWSFILGYAIWGEKPVFIVILGAILITLSGVLIVLEEWWAARRG